MAERDTGKGEHRHTHPQTLTGRDTTAPGKRIERDIDVVVRGEMRRMAGRRTEREPAGYDTVRGKIGLEPIACFGFG